MLWLEKSQFKTSRLMLFPLENIKDDKYEKYIVNISYKLSHYVIINSKSIMLFMLFFLYSG